MGHRLGMVVSYSLLYFWRQVTLCIRDLHSSVEALDIADCASFLELISHFSSSGGRG